ncbi:hypothetical protein D0T25_03970 [Duganella sp. BJB488]|nr:hypothetical protein D0T26_04010 [Duganella sp. BJB489]RFP27022.1 hypothetical protein D0T25_03970 [Duganella sp. BJB488]RFP34891.1 hypothetical protein D0T24_14060 [Duganella sp. BJB480]
MKDDIRAGALLPTITLSAALEAAQDLKRLCQERDFPNLVQRLTVVGGVNILDGLQRTYILADLQEEGHVFAVEQTVHLEIRIEENLDNLIYRIIVLNAGQKPMSMRHQIEVLFSAFRSTLERTIDRLELISENEEGRRTRARRYALDKVATAYHTYLLKSPEVEKQNIVAQKISEESVLSQDETKLGEDFAMFQHYLGQYAALDDEICRVYDGSIAAAPTGAAWFGNENVMNAFFSSVSDFGSSPARKDRIDRALAVLLQKLQTAQVGTDPLGLVVLQRIIEGLPVRKVNVGFGTRKLLNTAFKEYFRDEGDSDIAEIWQREAE